MLGILIIILLVIGGFIGSAFYKHWVYEEYKTDQEQKYTESNEAYKKRIDDNEKEMKSVVRIGRLLGGGVITLICLVILGLTTIRIVPTGTVGVKTSFGVVSGRATEGFNLIAPWEEIVSMDTKIQKQSFTALTASTKDAQSITNINIDVNYNLNPDKADQVYSTVGEEYQDKLIAPLLTQFIKDRLALYNAESLVTERNKIVEDITTQLRENLADYGVNVVAVSLVNYDFSPDFNAALERKAVAEKEIETAKNNQEKAKVEAETNRIKTEQLTEAVLMEKLIDAIKNGNGTYIIDTNNLSIGVK